MTLRELIESGAAAFTRAQLCFGHGTTNAFDEAAWLALWRLGLPLDTALEPGSSEANRPLALVDIESCATLFEARIQTRQPAAYLTHEAWLQGVAFYVDERCIVPRSLIAEVMADASLDYWLGPQTRRVLDLCTGNGSLAVLAALTYPDIEVIASDISAEALEVARLNVERYALQARVQLVQADGLCGQALAQQGPFDLILCNPPYVNAESMGALPAEYAAEPALALDGNRAGGQDGMDFIRSLLAQVRPHLSAWGVLVLEVGHERAHFEAAFPQLQPIWLTTSAGSDQVLVLPYSALLA